MFRILGLLFCVLPLCSCSHAPGALTEARTDKELKKLQSCDADSDCVRVDNGCCDCANGGQSTAINRQYEKEFRDGFDCRNVFCSQKVGNCLYLDPVCRNHRCELGKRPKLFPI